MKKFLLLYKILFVSLPAFAQLRISSGTQWVNSGNVAVVVNNLDLINDGTLVAGKSSIKFTGNQNSTITGSGTPAFSILEVAKTNGAKITLGKNINVSSSINFISGLLDLNSNNIVLDPAAYLAGESENARIIGANGGFVEITQNLNAPLSANPGNLGATLTSNVNLGTVTVKRGHVPQSGAGLNSSIQRYYSITPQNNSGLNATLRLKYFDAELNGQNENILVEYQSNDNGLNWTNLSQNTRNVNADYVEKTGLNSLSLQTLGNDISSGPVTGLVFNAKRKKPTEVELTWSTTMETNMLGFEVQRKLDNEPDFAATAFVNSKAPGGNSTTTLSYLQIDPNSYTGTSYYRLKIVDLNNNISYSDIKSVDGKTKGGGGKNNTIQDADTVMTTSAKAELWSDKLPARKITVGPNPNNGNFWFTVSGIEKETSASLYTIDGKLLKQFRVANLQQEQVNGLRNGMYILKVDGLKLVKIVVHGGDNPINRYPTINTSSMKN
jgi:hypothetical protein